MIEDPDVTDDEVAEESRRAMHEPEVAALLDAAGIGCCAPNCDLCP